MLRLSQSATAAPAIPSRSSVETNFPFAASSTTWVESRLASSARGPLELLGLALGERRRVVDAAADPDELAVLAVEEVERFGTKPRASRENP